MLIPTQLFSSVRLMGILLFIIILGASFIGYSAARSYKTDVIYRTGTQKLSMEHIFNGTFSVDRKSVNWVPEGAFSTAIPYHNPILFL